MAQNKAKLCLKCRKSGIMMEHSRLRHHYSHGRCTLFTPLDIGDRVPALYCLLTNKSETTYQRLFQTIRQLIPNARPTSFPIDFEMSAINAIRTVVDYDNAAVNVAVFSSQ